MVDNKMQITVIYCVNFSGENYETTKSLCDTLISALGNGSYLMQPLSEILLSDCSEWISYCSLSPLYLSNGKRFAYFKIVVETDVPADTDAPQTLKEMSRGSMILSKIDSATHKIIPSSYEIDLYDIDVDTVGY